MEQRRWIEISNRIMACSVAGKDKVGPAEVFFGSLCVQTHKREEVPLFFFFSFPFFFSSALFLV